MSVLFFMSTAFYWIGMFWARGEGNTMSMLGSRLAWVAVVMALVGTLVRWFESHQIGPDIGHIPVSNLYEVFVMFCWMTARSTCTTKSSTHPLAGRFRDAGGECGGGLPALVHRGARGA
jgi:ABC-type transport system involved in cytochrome c biogenesis permease subunit